MMIDLYLGSDIGLWALEQVPREVVKNVLTLDEHISCLAHTRDLNVITKNANRVTFEASQIGFSVHYPRIIRGPLIQKYRKLYNLHPGYLPWGKGFYPVFWALWENTPAGATLHEITLGIDEGPIVEQVEVSHSIADTGFTLFERVRNAEKEIFLKYWPKMVKGKDLTSYAQVGEGSYHSKKEFFELKQLTDWQSLAPEKLLHLIRCLSFPDYSGLEIESGGQHFSVKLEPLETYEN